MSSISFPYRNAFTMLIIKKWLPDKPKTPRVKTRAAAVQTFLNDIMPVASMVRGGMLVPGVLPAQAPSLLKHIHQGLHAISSAPPAKKPAAGLRFRRDKPFR